mgnify:CR=1 FL=1|tara:strand:+ start:1312 stop:1560 length:249 start_codon:yes stop_codon:yes gene_type:complete
METVTQKITKEFLKSFEPMRVLRKTTRSDRDEYIERLSIPWYLKPFRARIKTLCGMAWTDGRYSIAEKVTFKRPKAYSNENL